MALARTPAPTTGPTDFAAGIRGTVIRPDDAAYDHQEGKRNAHGLPRGSFRQAPKRAVGRAARSAG